MNCSNCKSPITPNMKFCESCGTKLVQITKSKNSGGMFDLAEGEKEIKTYHCTTLTDPQTEGYICVTTKRVVYYAIGKSSKTFNEIYLDQVAGINSYYGSGKIIKYLKMAIISGLATLFLYYSYAETIFKLTGVLITAFFVYKYFFDKRIIYYFNILSKSSKTPSISIGVFGGGLTGQGAAVSREASPTPQTDSMIRELGAVILDAKNFGIESLQIWHNN